MIAVYHYIKKEENFEESVQILFELLKDAQTSHLDEDRTLYLDIEEHKNKNGGFDDDMFESQGELMGKVLINYFSFVFMPLGNQTNPNKQENNIPSDFKVSRK